MGDRARGAVLALLGASCWGASGCIGQYLFQFEGMTSTWLVPIRLGLAGLLLLAYYLMRNPRQTLSVWSAPDKAATMVVYGLLGVSLCQFFYFLTIQLSSAGFATIAQDTSPIIILAFVCITQHRGPKPLEIISIVLAIFGLLLLVTHADLAQLAVSPEALAAGIGSAVCVFIYTVTPHKLQEEYPTPMLQGWAFLMGGVAFSILFRPWEISYVPSLVGIGGIAAVVLLGNILAFSCYMSGVHLVGPQVASLCSFAEPTMAAIISTTVLGTPFTGWDAAGFACIFGMLLMLFWSSVRTEARR